MTPSLSNTARSTSQAPNACSTSRYTGHSRQARAHRNRAVAAARSDGPSLSRYVWAITNPLNTKNRSTPRAPEVTSGPSASTTWATPGSGVKWKWNSTTHPAATARSPVRPRISPPGIPPDDAARVPDGVAEGRGSVTLGETRPDRPAVRVTPGTYRLGG